MPQPINKDCLYFFLGKDSEAQSNFQGGLSRDSIYDYVHSNA